MTSRSPVEVVAEAILRGEYDDQLDQLWDVMRARHDMLRERRTTAARATLRPGVRVQVGNTVKPAYYRGVKGTVVRLLQKRVLVDLDGYGELRVPATLLERIHRPECYSDHEVGCMCGLESV